MTDTAVAVRPDPGTPLDPFGLWDAWARSLTLYGPLSGPVNQAIQTMLARHLGQLGLINISTAAAPDPELERRIVEQVASYGRQLGWIVDAVDVLVRERRGEEPRRGDEEALEQLERLRRDVEQVKARAATERRERLVDDVRALVADRAANAGTIATLRALLADPDE
jgi:hypothetical protein